MTSTNPFGRLELERYPRSRRYDPAWILENQMGPHPLWLLESLIDVMPIARAYPTIRVTPLSRAGGWPRA